jgi:hypothetical protein
MKSVILPMPMISYTRAGPVAMSYSTVCGPCEDRFRQHGELFDTQQQAEEWIQDENS